MSPLFCKAVTLPCFPPNLTVPPPTGFHTTLFSCSIAPVGWGEAGMVAVGEDIPVSEARPVQPAGSILSRAHLLRVRLSHAGEPASRVGLQGQEQVSAKEHCPHSQTGRHDPEGPMFPTAQPSNSWPTRGILSGLRVIWGVALLRITRHCVALVVLNFPSSLKLH